MYNFSHKIINIKFALDFQVSHYLTVTTRLRARLVDVSGKWPIYDTTTSWIARSEHCRSWITLFGRILHFSLTTLNVIL